MRTIIIIILILLVLGLYFATDFTKDAMKTTGRVTLDAIKKIAANITQSDTVNDSREKIAERVSGEIAGD